MDKLNGIYTTPVNNMLNITLSPFAAAAASRPSIDIWEDIDGKLGQTNRNNLDEIEKQKENFASFDNETEALI